MRQFSFRLLCFAAALLVAGSVDTAFSKDVKPLEIGMAAPDFALPGVDGKTHRLSDFADAKVLVVVFTCNHCPTAQAYEERLIKLSTDFATRGVAVVAISPNDPKAVRLDELGYTDVSDSLDDMKLRARDRKFPFPYLYDGETQTVSTAYGALATPHVFIFDSERKLRYVGRIDDSDVGIVKSHDARNAIDALLAKRPVAVNHTRVFGCSTKWADKRQSAVEAHERWDREPVSVKLIDARQVRTLAENRSKTFRLINVWATWCGPCVEELSELVTINRMYRKRPFHMVTISLDGVKNREQVLKVLVQNHVSCQNFLFNSEDKDALAESLDPKWLGPLPMTVLIAPGGKIVFRKQGELDPLALKRAIVQHLGRTYGSVK